MAIANKVIEEHGGKTTVHSQPGSGTKTKATLPHQRPDGTQTAEQKIPKEEGFMKIKILTLCALFLILAATLFGCATTGSEQTDTSAPSSTDTGGHHGHH